MIFFLRAGNLMTEVIREERKGNSHCPGGVFPPSRPFLHSQYSHACFQKTAKRAAKGGLSACKRPPFTSQKATFCNAARKYLGTNKLQKHKTNRRNPCPDRRRIFHFPFLTFRQTAVVFFTFRLSFSIQSHVMPMRKQQPSFNRKNATETLNIFLYDTINGK